MARMIPAEASPSCKSPGEREIFLRLKQHRATKDWVVLHSLDIAHHVKQTVGEADFVVIVPGKGVLVLECKAHNHVQRKEGLWFYGAGAKGDARGPFKQASEAMHSIRQRLIQRRPDLARVVFWSAVIFPFAEGPSTIATDEWHPWQMVDSRAFRAQPMHQLVLGVLDQARTFLVTCPTASWFHGQSGEPYAEQVTAIADTLRPDFELLESPKAEARRHAEDVKRYTEEQFAALDGMELNERAAFLGPAGSGKTALAMEAARRSAQAGRKVLFLCFNHLLGDWLKEQMAGVSGVTTRTLHSYMLGLAGVSPREDAPDFWRTDLPRLALDGLSSDEASIGAFDELILDEAQDVLRADYLYVLEWSLRGGLSAGRWRLFGDFEKQQIYNAADMSLDQFLSVYGSAAPKFALRVNCRNTPRIGSYAQVLGGLHPGYSRFLRPDDQRDPTRIYYKDDSDQKQQLLAQLEDLYSGGFSGDDIVVLSAKGDRDCIARAVTDTPWTHRLHRYSEAAGRGYIGYTTIHSFKGLEAPVVVVTDINHIADDQAQDLLYVALTRALTRVIILAHESVKRDLVKALANS